MREMIPDSLGGNHVYCLIRKDGFSLWEVCSAASIESDKRDGFAWWGDRIPLSDVPPKLQTVVLSKTEKYDTLNHGVAHPRTRNASPPTVEAATGEAVRAANTAMDHLGMIKRALYAQQPSWATASRVAADSLYTVALVRAAHDVEMAVHAARDAGTLPRAVVKDLAFDVQVAAQRAARTAQALCTQVVNHRGSGDLTSDLASAINLADRDIHNAYLACNSLLSAVTRPR